MNAEAHLRDLFGRMLALEARASASMRRSADIPVAVRAVTPVGLPHSAWQLLGHLERTQHDILDFCINPHYVELKWPDDYWPPSPVPPSAVAWDESVSKFLEDRKSLQRLAADARIDLTASIPRGSGQTSTRASSCWLPTTRRAPWDS